jgi:hypothetical protein
MKKKGIILLVFFSQRFKHLVQIRIINSERIM